LVWNFEQFDSKFEVEREEEETRNGCQYQIGGVFNAHAIPSLRGHEDLFKASLNVGVFKITDKPDKIKEKLTKKNWTEMKNGLIDFQNHKF